MIRTQMGTHNRSEVVAVHGNPCAIPPCNSNSNSNNRVLLDTLTIFVLLMHAVLQVYLTFIDRVSQLMRSPAGCALQ
jgi:hypothetical protein